MKPSKILLNCATKYGDLRKDMDVKLSNLKFELLKWPIGLVVV